MRSKAPLALMEQAVMVLVFALAAALCLRVFVWSDQTSKRGEARDQAAILAQTVAEVLKQEGAGGGDAAAVMTAAAQRLGGSCTQGLLVVNYDEDQSPSAGTLPPGEKWYRVEAQGVPAQVPGLWTVHVSVLWDEAGEQEPDVLFEIDVAWQGEVA